MQSEGVYTNLLIQLVISYILLQLLVCLNLTNNIGDEYMAHSSRLPKKNSQRKFKAAKKQSSRQEN